MNTDFTIVGGVAEGISSALYTSWWHRPDYQEAVVSALGAQGLAEKRLVMDFEAALADVVTRGRIEAEIDGVLERFLVEEYRQRNPAVGQGRAGLAHWFRTVAAFLPGTPPPPVALSVEKGLVTVLLELRLPGPGGGDMASFLLALFRVEAGKLVEHWGGGDLPPEKRD
jgi:predicted SnoaL-like aldol condensation-catalyzing enzyme